MIIIEKSELEDILKDVINSMEKQIPVSKCKTAYFAGSGFHIDLLDGRLLGLFYIRQLLTDMHGLKRLLYISELRLLRTIFKSVKPDTFKETELMKNL